jgi:hypothetical protein
MYVGSKLGGELVVAAKVGVHQGATVILGDRLYGVTIQRVFDKLKLYEKLKMAFVLIWEIMTMSFFKLKDYIKKSENEEGFIQDEIARFAKHLPAFAKVLIEERDEYLSQTIFEIARVVNQSGGQKRIRIVAVVGAGHLSGIQKCLAVGGVSDDRIIEISSSTKHPYPGTWLGRGMLQVVSPMIFQQLSETGPIVEETQQVGEIQQQSIQTVPTLEQQEIAANSKSHDTPQEKEEPVTINQNSIEKEVVLGNKVENEILLESKVENDVVLESEVVKEVEVEGEKEVELDIKGGSITGEIVIEKKVECYV